jgi:hypothetical protein
MGEKLKLKFEFEKHEQKWVPCFKISKHDTSKLEIKEGIQNMPMFETLLHPLPFKSSLKRISIKLLPSIWISL